MAGRILSLDLGKARIGVAMSDVMGIIASPYCVVNGENEKKSMAEIKKICEEKNIVKVIAGLPLNMSGGESQQTKDVKNYVEKLKLELKLDIIYQDERLTSVQAEKLLHFQNRKPSRIKPEIDKLAAAIILQQYLDRNN